MSVQAEKSQSTATVFKSIVVTPKKTVYMDPSYEPGFHDVICQRGKAAFAHVGNRRMRLLVYENSAQYGDPTSSKVVKSSVVTRIIDTIRSRGGRFVRYDGTQKAWLVVRDRIIREKVGHSLREASMQAAKPSNQTSGIQPYQLMPTLRNPSSCEVPEWTRTRNVWNFEDKNTSTSLDAKEVLTASKVPSESAMSPIPLDDSCSGLDDVDVSWLGDLLVDDDDSWNKESDTLSGSCRSSSSKPPRPRFNGDLLVDNNDSWNKESDTLGGSCRSSSKPPRPRFDAAWASY